MWREDNRPFQGYLPLQAMEFASNRPNRADDSYQKSHGRSLLMAVSLLNDSQQRRLGTHLSLLVSDVAASLDPGVDEVRRRLEALGAAARSLPEGAA